MNIDSVYFKQKKDIVNSINAFNELEKVRLNYVPKKKVLILNQSNISCLVIIIILVEITISDISNL